MQKKYWLLLLISSFLYGLAFIFIEYLWFLIFLFPIPLLYTAAIQSLSFFSGFIWGLCTCIFHSFGGIYILMCLAQKCWFIGLLIGIAIVIYQAFFIGLLFFITQQFINYCLFKAVHIYVYVWTITLFFIFLWLDQYSLLIGEVREGYPLMNPLLPLTVAPQLLICLSKLSQPLVMILLFLLSANLVIFIHKKNKKNALFFLCTITPWIVWYFIAQKKENIWWHNTIKTIPAMMQCYSSDPLCMMQITAYTIKNILHSYPQTKIIILPETSFNGIIKVPEIINYWSHSYIGKPIHIVFGTSRTYNNHYYNSIYWVYDGVIQKYYDKTHAMLISERLPSWLNTTYVRSIFYKDDISITASHNERLSLPLLETIEFVPYLCSEFFFSTEFDKKNNPIVVMVNDSLFSCSIYSRYIQRLLVALAQLKAIEYQRDIVYVSYAYSLFINKQGMIYE